MNILNSSYRSSRPNTLHKFIKLQLLLLYLFVFWLLPSSSVRFPFASRCRHSEEWTWWHWYAKTGRKVERPNSMRWTYYSCTTADVRRPWHRCRLSVVCPSVTDVLWLYKRCEIWPRLLFWSLIRSHISAFKWHENHCPWTTLKVSTATGTV